MLNTINNNASAARSGTTYLAVVGVSTIVAVIGLASMSVARLEFRANGWHNQKQEARVLATAGVEFAINWINNNSNWRTFLINDTETPLAELGNGTMSWKVQDSDADLDDDHSDVIALYGYGRVGDIVAVESVKLEPTGTGLSCLEAALHCERDITITDGSSLSRHDIITNQTISSNDAIDARANYASITGDAWAVDNITGDITGSSAPYQSPPRQLPGADVFDYYKTNGTWINISDLPTSGGVNLIDKEILSPANNPWGAGNPEGIYVIDCQGEDVSISNSRIVGTLVLLNPGSSSLTHTVLLMQPAVANYPVLLIDGDFRITSSDAWLEEFSQGTNFNPVGTPYLGEENTDTDDTYPSELQGLVYISGKAIFTGSNFPKIDGCLVCDEVIADTTFTVDYKDIYLTNPPPGFASGSTMRIMPGSWRRTTAD